MEPIESNRVSHPSSAQEEMLIEYLEERPSLAKGFLKNPNAKARAYKEWETLTTKLNSVGGGAIKTSKKWIKYWSDKKSSVKRKASARDKARRRTGGGIEDIPELNEIEERIVALMGGGGFATGDVHLRLQVFDEPTPASSDSPSILVGLSQNTAAMVLQQPGPSSSAASLYHPIEVYEDNIHLNVDTPTTLVHQPPQPPTILQTIQRELTPEPPRRPEAVAESHGDNASAASTPRRRRFRAIRQSPPSQRRSQFTSVADKFLKLEEQRLTLESRVASVLEQNIETNRLMAQANIALGEGLKALAETLKRN